MQGLEQVTTAALGPAAEAAVDAAVLTIPPLWPLSSSVAVNPFLGQAHESIEQAAARLARTAGVAITMPRSWYAERLINGSMNDADLAAALAASEWQERPRDVAALKPLLDRPVSAPRAVPTIADLAASASGVDWPGIIADRIGHWAAGYFDEGQALWRASRERCAYLSWRETATHDLTPEVLGLPGFARFAAVAPETARAALARGIATLELDDAALEGAFARLLMTLGGWAQYGRFLRFEAELGGAQDATALDLLAIRLLWDEALLLRYRDEIAPAWASARATHSALLTMNDDQRIDSILQYAAELGAQRDLAAKLTHAVAGEPQAPAIQAAFCIDVRSERLRRAMEATDPGVQTLGFAGFFGLATAHRRFASDVVEKRLPVLLNPGVTSVARAATGEGEDQRQRYRARASRAWGRFKLAAVSSFAFVEAAGPIYLQKLVRDALGRAATPTGDPAPQLDPPLPLAVRADAAENILRAMSLTKDFAPLVLIVGHGAQVTNNPHASALQCGACGGYAGEVNARLLAGLLNDADVRLLLTAKGIQIPAGTLFVGALHDTTRDTVLIYDRDDDLAAQRADLTRAHEVLDRAGRVVRAERASRLPRAERGDAVLARAFDWAETRPEWGLAGARAFIAAPRRRTIGRSLEGQAFLHDYDWRADKNFGVLELILTAPVVVASWISLQYYGSVVAPTLFGGGNKLLHNVTGGIGVVEGNGGLLRGGLPWQSVHDGEKLIHEPMRMTVCVEAPRSAITEMLAKHDHVRALFDNRWLHLLVLDGFGQVAWRYCGGNWQAVAAQLGEGEHECPSSAKLNQ